VNKRGSSVVVEGSGWLRPGLSTQTDFSSQLIASLPWERVLRSYPKDRNAGIQLIYQV
jgi:hypothetical protein